MPEADLFPNWASQPIAAELDAFLRTQTSPEPGTTAIYCLRPDTKAYVDLAAFIGVMLRGLPYNNEVGQTILMRRDAREVNEHLAQVFLDEKKLKDISSFLR